MIESIKSIILSHKDKIKRALLTAEKIGVEGVLVIYWDGSVKYLISPRSSATPLPEEDSVPMITIHNHPSGVDVPSIKDLETFYSRELPLNCIAVRKGEDKLKISCYLVNFEAEEDFRDEALYLEEVASDYTATGCVEVDDKEICGDEALEYIDRLEQEIVKNFVKKVFEIEI